MASAMSGSSGQPGSNKGSSGSAKGSSGSSAGGRSSGPSGSTAAGSSAGSTAAGSGTTESADDGGGADDASMGTVVQTDAGTYNMLVTFYGWDDNCPPGNTIAYPMSDGNPTVHNTASGTGTYADPLTMATDAAELAIGTLVYVPYIQKYAVMEDDCTECDTDWATNMTRHIDIWMNSNGTENAQDLENCEANWSPCAPIAVQVDPPSGLTVSPTVLFTPATNTCAPAP